MSMLYLSVLDNKQIRKECTRIVQECCKKYDLGYRETWNTLYRKYNELHHINPHELYSNDIRGRDKLDMLEMYEGLYGTLTKFHTLLKQLE